MMQQEDLSQMRINNPSGGRDVAALSVSAAAIGVVSNEFDEGAQHARFAHVCGSVLCEFPQQGSPNDRG